jgi:hypothetical protein
MVLLRDAHGHRKSYNNLGNSTGAISGARNSVPISYGIRTIAAGPYWAREVPVRCLLRRVYGLTVSNNFHDTSRAHRELLAPRRTLPMRRTAREKTTAPAR